MAVLLATAVTVGDGFTNKLTVRVLVQPVKVLVPVTVRVPAVFTVYCDVAGPEVQV